MRDDSIAEGRTGTPQATVAVASYDDYASAQRAVDFLSDNNFPVDRVRIVGSDLRLVEQVHGRLTTGRAALAGAGTGAWFGLLIGILLGAFAVGAWWRVLLFAVIAGA
ncbi:general stress protein, partial [Dactylosporangium vinaceum]